MPTSNLLFLALSLGFAVGLFLKMELKQEMTQGIDTNNIKHKHESISRNINNSYNMDPATKSYHYDKYIYDLLGLCRVLDKNRFRVNRLSVSNENMQHIGACKYMA